MSGTSIKTADDLTKSAQAATNAISEWGTRVNTFIQVGGQINELEKLLNATKVFQIAGGASVILGLLDGGLLLYCLLAGIPSKEDLIFQSLTENSNKLTSLSNQLETLYDKLATHADLNEAKRTAHEAAKYINDQTLLLKQYSEAKERHEDTSTLEIEIFGENNHKCEDKLEALKKQANTLKIAAIAEGVDAQLNLLKLIYASEYGNATTVATYGAYLLTHANQALILYGVFHSRYFKDKTKSIEEYHKIAQRDADPISSNVNSISVAFDKYMHQCYSNWLDDVTRFINDKYYNTLSIPATPDKDSYKYACDVIQSGLKANWPWSDWLVIMHSKAIGYRYHCLVHPNYPTYYAHWTGLHGGFGLEKREVDITIGRVDSDPNREFSKTPGLRHGLWMVTDAWLEQLRRRCPGSYPIPSAEDKHVIETGNMIYKAIDNGKNVVPLVYVVYHDKLFPCGSCSNNERFHHEAYFVGLTSEYHYHAFVMM